MITFSIVTVTYNAASVLRATLDSVLAQDYPEVEHIIVDGASGDDTLRMVDEYVSRSEQAETGHRIVVVSEPDRGIYDAMNKGLSKATGDYISFLNAGDRLPSGETLSGIALAAEGVADGEWPAVLYGDTDIVDEAGRFLFHRRLSPPDHLSWRSFRHGMLVCHQAFYARTDIARSVPYDTRYRFSADVDWCIRVMKEAGQRGLRLQRVSGVVAHYLQEGATTRHHRRSLLERFRVMTVHYGWLTTIMMHGWFVIRGIVGKIKNKG